MKGFEKVPPRYRNPQCFRICMIAKAYSEEKTVEAMEYCIKVDRCNAIELVAFLIARYGEQKAKREKASLLPNKVFDKTKVSDGLLWHIEQLERMLWFEDSQNLIFIDKCDKGKTALATYFAKQILKNDKVYYCTIDEFLYILRYKDKKRKAAAYIQVHSRLRTYYS